MEGREEAGGVGGRGGRGGERRERGRKAEEQGSSPSCRPPSLPPSPESRDQLAARTAASDPPIARAFITCLGPGSLPFPPPLPTAVQRGRQGPGAARPLPASAPTLRTGCGRRQPHRPPELRPPPPLRPTRPAAGRRGSRGSGFLPSPRAAGIRLLRGGGSGCIPGTLAPRRRPRRLLLPAGLSPLSGPRLPSAAGRRSPVPPLRSLLSALGSVMAAAELPRLSLG